LQEGAAGGGQTIDSGTGIRVWDGEKKGTHSECVWSACL
jgi:hypothetical protein